MSLLEVPVAFHWGNIVDNVLPASIQVALKIASCNSALIYICLTTRPPTFSIQLPAKLLDKNAALSVY